jgi:excisionase family DNA binding protein
MKFYKINEIAEMLQISKSTLYRLIREGKIKAHSLGKGYTVFIRLEDVPEYLRKDI